LSDQRHPAHYCKLADRGDVRLAFSFSCSTFGVAFKAANEFKAEDTTTGHPQRQAPPSKLRVRAGCLVKARIRSRILNGAAGRRAERHVKTGWVPLNVPMDSGRHIGPLNSGRHIGRFWHSHLKKKPEAINCVTLERRPREPDGGGVDFLAVDVLQGSNKSPAYPTP
jgi:hypothetical protein